MMRSRFYAAIAPDSAIVAVQTTTRQARFGELSLRVLDNARITKTIAASFGVTGRSDHRRPPGRGPALSTATVGRGQVAGGSRTMAGDCARPPRPGVVAKRVASILRPSRGGDPPTLKDAPEVVEPAREEGAGLALAPP